MMPMAAFTVEDEDIAGIEPVRPCPASAFRAAKPENPRIAERDRHDRRILCFFIPVAVQAHFRFRRIPVDQATFRRIAYSRDPLPYIEYTFRYARPRTAGDRVPFAITIACIIGQPPEAACARHPHGKRLTRAGHGRAKQGCHADNLPDIIHEAGLLFRLQKTRIEAHSPFAEYFAAFPFAEFDAVLIQIRVIPNCNRLYCLQG